MHINTYTHTIIHTNVHKYSTYIHIPEPHRRLDPPRPQVTVGFLLLYTLVINSAYRSSLIAHLTVQGFPPPIDSFDDLLEQGGWTWGSQPLFGTFFVFFNQSSDPVVQRIYAGMEVWGAALDVEILVVSYY